MCATYDGDGGQSMPAREKSRGKQKIDIEYLQNQTARKQTFRKRNRGLFKKATELAKLCGATVALRVSLDEPKGKSYDYYYYSWKPDSENMLPMKCTQQQQQQHAAAQAPSSCMDFCATMNNMMASFEGAPHTLAHTLAAAAAAAVGDESSLAAAAVGDESSPAACDESSSDYASSSGTNDESQEEAWTEIGSQNESQMTVGIGHVESQESIDTIDSMRHSSLAPGTDMRFLENNNQQVPFLDKNLISTAELDASLENPDDYLNDEPTNETYWNLWGLQ